MATLFGFLVFIQIVCSIQASNVNIISNGYTNLLVAISSDVANTKAQQILTNIQNMMIDGSAILYQATGQRAYLADVTILIPKSWKNINALQDTWETYEEADIQITLEAGLYGNTPYTLNVGNECGQPAEYIHFTAEYIASTHDDDNIRKYGPPGKVFVHEWSHLRYGVFDEYGFPADSRFPLFYTENENVYPNICPAADLDSFTIKDITTNTNCPNPLDNSNCRYFFTNYQNNASLLSHHYFDSVFQFCDDTNHNPKAPNKQNSICHQSVWATIRQHPDFADNNHARIVSDTKPVFKIVRQSDPRYVIVLDTSNSMNEEERIWKQFDAVGRWILHQIPDGTRLGIVQFNTEASIISELVQINNRCQRNELVKLVPQRASGASCLSCGINKALEMLNKTGDGKGIIIVISDGPENIRRIVQPHLMWDGRAVNFHLVTIALGYHTGVDLESMVEGTNGKSYFIPTPNIFPMLNNVLDGSLNYLPDYSGNNAIFKIYEETFMNEQTATGNFYVDLAATRNLRITVNFPLYLNLSLSTVQIKTFAVTSPSGTTYSLYKSDLGVAYMNLCNAEVGQWRYDFVTNFPDLELFLVEVTAQADPNVTPITTRCWVNQGAVVNDGEAGIIFFAQVQRGGRYIPNVNVEVVLSTPRNEIERIVLEDRGVTEAGDVTARDGIYSNTYNTRLRGGRYSAICKITGDGRRTSSNASANSALSDRYSGHSIIVNDSNTSYCCGNDGLSNEDQELDRFFRNYTTKSFFVNITTATIFAESFTEKISTI